MPMQAAYSYGLRLNQKVIHTMGILPTGSKFSADDDPKNRLSGIMHNRCGVHAGCCSFKRRVYTCAAS